MRTPHSLRVAFAAAVTATTLLLLDLLWLGVVARSLYDTALGPLKRPDAYWPAAALFYALYIAAIVIHAELAATGLRDAARRGAGLGLVAYGTYELTNWAVLQGWPAGLVLPDIAWGVVLTAVAAVAGKAALGRSWTARSRPASLGSMGKRRLG